ncbi:MAG: 3-dehydroquinate synthase [Phycisphaeraceae bacterium]
MSSGSPPIREGSGTDPTPAELILRLPYRLMASSSIAHDNNPLLDELLGDSSKVRLIVFVDDGLAAAQPRFVKDLTRRLSVKAGWSGLHLLPGGERAKNDRAVFDGLIETLAGAGLCRHSYVVVAGGGAVLDVVGFAASMVHRGVRLIRIPSTTLAQADSGVGVKNGINAYGQKNFLGTFAVPDAVVLDPTLLESLTPRDWRCGLSEVVKVALLKDADLFQAIERFVGDHPSDRVAAQPLWLRSAELHAQHVLNSGDPFELTSARPLDLGHWSAHQLEVMSSYRLRHGEAVSLGLALDTIISQLVGVLEPATAERIIRCLDATGLPVFDDLLLDTGRLLEGLDRFRQHLGGVLSIPLIHGVGDCRAVSSIDTPTIHEAVNLLAQREVSHAV